MAALPTTTTAFASGATEAQFKTFLTGQRDYLVGLFGADGTAATAKATLGTNDGVTAVNGNAGAISAAQIAAAAVASWGYTPPNPSGLNADTVDGYHYNNLPYVPKDTNGAVGEYAFAAQHTGSPVANGATLNGSYVYRYVLQNGTWTQGAAMGGTCRNISGATASSSGAALGIWQRIA